MSNIFVTRVTNPAGSRDTFNWLKLAVTGFVTRVTGFVTALRPPRHSTRAKVLTG
jgi:hypothetical protein